MIRLVGRRASPEEHVLLLGLVLLLCPERVDTLSCFGGVGSFDNGLAHVLLLSVPDDLLHRHGELAALRLRVLSQHRLVSVVRRPGSSIEV